MKSFIVLICVAAVFAGEDMFGEKKMMKSWMHHKSMESCFGEDMMKTSLLKCKKAVVKCTGVDAPELDLPMFKSPHRMVHALLQSAEEHKQTQMLSAMQQMHKQNSNGGGNNPTIQLVLGGAQQQQAQPENGMFKKMMMKMMMKKMFNEMGGSMGGSSPFGNMESSGNKDTPDLLKMLMQNMRNKRAADDDIYELGDRLTEKLKAEQVAMQQKLGNASCVMQELGMVDANLDLDVNGMVESVKKGEWGVFPDQWLKEHHIKDCQMCAAMANSIPSMVFEECPFGEKWGRIMMFFMCEKKHKYKTCMNHDMKNKLEKSFGSLEELENATGLQEYQLLPMTMKLLNDQMDMFM